MVLARTQTPAGDAVERLLATIMALTTFHIGVQLIAFPANALDNDRTRVIVDELLVVVPAKACCTDRENHTFQLLVGARHTMPQGDHLRRRLVPKLLSEDLQHHALARSHITRHHFEVGTPHITIAVQREMTLENFDHVGHDVLSLPRVHELSWDGLKNLPDIDWLHHVHGCAGHEPATVPAATGGQLPLRRHRCHYLVLLPVGVDVDSMPANAAMAVWVTGMGDTDRRLRREDRCRWRRLASAEVRERRRESREVVSVWRFD